MRRPRYRDERSRLKRLWMKHELEDAGLGRSSAIRIVAFGFAPIQPGEALIRFLPFPSIAARTERATS